MVHKCSACGSDNTEHVDTFVHVEGPITEYYHCYNCHHEDREDFEAWEVDKRPLP